VNSMMHERLMDLFRLQGVRLRVATVIETVEAILSRTGRKFAYVRYGDGELMMMAAGHKGRSFTQYNSPRFRQELLEGFVIDHPDYLIGIQAGYPVEHGMRPGLFAPHRNDRQLREIVAAHQDIARPFYSGIVFQYLMIFFPNLLKTILDQFALQRVLFVGGKHLAGVTKFLGAREFIGIPERQAYDQIESWYPGVLKAAENAEIAFISAGPTANVLQKRLWRDSDVASLDVGSFSSAVAQLPDDPHTWIRETRDQIQAYVDLYGQ